MKEISHPSGYGGNGNHANPMPQVIYLPGGGKIRIPSSVVEPSPPHQRAQRATTPKPVEVAQHQFPDGTKLRLMADPKDPTRTLFAVWRGGDVQLREEFEYDNVVYKPPKRDD